MIRNNTKYILGVIIALFSIVNVSAQVKIGDNHEIINAGSLLELESSNKGFMFPRLSLDNDLTVWKLNGNDPIDGMVVFNVNDEINYEGLYCWYNGQWNLFANNGNIVEFDTLHFNSDTRFLYDDEDSVEVASGRVRIVDSVEILQEQLLNGDYLEGDINYVYGEGVYIKNNIDGATVAESFIFIPANANPGRILYASYNAAEEEFDTTDFKLGDSDTYYNEPNTPILLSVDPPSVSGNNGYYAFSVPNTWADPRIFLKVKDSKDGGYYKLNDCWTVYRNMEYEGVLYQVWMMDTPLRESVMDIVDSKAQFMIQ